MALSGSNRFQCNHTSKSIRAVQIVTDGRKKKKRKRNKVGQEGKGNASGRSWGKGMNTIKTTAQKFQRTKFHFCLSVCACACLYECHVCVGVHRGQKRVLDPLEMDL